MQKLLLILGLFASINCAAQSIPDSATSGDITLEGMKNIFYCGVGEAPVMVSTQDRQFEKQFETGYYLIGCVLPFSRETMIAHNKFVADLLDKKYGITWRKKVRRDVPGVSN